MKYITLLCRHLLLLTVHAAANTPCIDTDGNLWNGQFVENGKCVNESIWYYALAPAPIASNGLEAGAPTDLHLLFGSLGHPVEDSFDYENFGLFIDGGKGKMLVELSPHFLYDTNTSNPAQGLWTTELGLGPANILFSAPCIVDVNTEQGQVICAGWVSELGNSKNQIVVVAPEGSNGLHGQRAAQAGIKFFHIHPVIELGSPIYNNANGTCDSNVTENAIFCRFASDCPGNSTCVSTRQPFTASATVTVYDEDGNIKHKGTRSYQFDAGPHFSVASTNTGTACNSEVEEMIDFERVEPGAICANLTRGGECDVEVTPPTNESLVQWSNGLPYAPRFFLIAPNINRTAFPQPPVPNLTATKDSPTTGSIFSGIDQIGSFELIQPTSGNAVILEGNLGLVGDGPARIGGSIFAVPVRAGTIPGKYIVQVTVKGGVMAQSRIIVVDPNASAGVCGSLSHLSWVVPMIVSILYMAIL